MMDGAFHGYCGYICRNRFLATEVFKAAITGRLFFTSPTPFIPPSTLYFSFSSPQRVQQNSMDYFDPNAGYYPTSTYGGFNAHLNQMPAPEHVAFDLGAFETSPYDWGLSQQQGYMSGSQDVIRPQGTFGEHDYNPVQGHGLTYICVSRVHIFGGLEWGVGPRL